MDETKIPRNFVVNREPASVVASTAAAFGKGSPGGIFNNANGGSEVNGKAPPPPPPLRTARPSGITSRLKPSGSSFGLHSPDNLPLGFNPQDDEVQVNI